MCEQDYKVTYKRSESLFGHLIVTSLRYLKAKNIRVTSLIFNLKEMLRVTSLKSLNYLNYLKVVS